MNKLLDKHRMKHQIRGKSKLLNLQTRCSKNSMLRVISLMEKRGRKSAVLIRSTMRLQYTNWINMISKCTIEGPVVKTMRWTSNWEPMILEIGLSQQLVQSLKMQSIFHFLLMNNRLRDHSNQKVNLSTKSQAKITEGPKELQISNAARFGQARVRRSVLTWTLTTWILIMLFQWWFPAAFTQTRLERKIWRWIIIKRMPDLPIKETGLKKDQVMTKVQKGIPIKGLSRIAAWRTQRCREFPQTET